MLKDYKLYCVGFLLYVASCLSVFGHGDQPHSDSPLSAAIPTTQQASSDLALVQRLFISKENQFKHGLLTTIAKSVERPKTFIVPGKIIASPNGYAQIHVPQSARVLVDDKFPIPTTGEKVTANQVIAVVEPLLSVIDITDKKSELYKIEGEIAILKRDIDRLEKLGEYSPRKELENKRTELERSEKQKSQLLSTGLGKELLLSPIDGIVSDNHLLPGQILQPNESAMEIINPDPLRVEAYMFDYLQADQIISARLRAPEQPEMFYSLRLIGASPRIGEKDYSRHLLFSIANASLEFIIGMAVDVLLTTTETISRIVIPKSALFKAGKTYTVFVLPSPELVKAHPVEVGLFFDQSVEIISGIKAGDRIISDTATLAKILTLKEEDRHVH